MIGLHPLSCLCPKCRIREQEDFRSNKRRIHLHSVAEVKQNPEEAKCNVNQKNGKVKGRCILDWGDRATTSYNDPTVQGEN